MGPPKTNKRLGDYSIESVRYASQNKKARCVRFINRQKFVNSPVKGVFPEFYFWFQLILDCMKTRTDDLSKMTVQVLKHYSKNDINEFDEGEMRFYEKYVKPIKKHL